MKEKKCVFVLGPESSGSMLVARIVAHVLRVREYGEWKGYHMVENESNRIYHRSLPYGQNSDYPDISEWIRENEPHYRLYFILCTRDITISEASRMERFNKSDARVRRESAKAREIMTEIMRQGFHYHLWSYESFMFLKDVYVKRLYKFLGITSDFIPELADGNKSRIQVRVRSMKRINGIMKRMFKKYIKNADHL